jgi:hypothetical protein
VTADADIVSGNLVFSTDGTTVVTDASTRRDARTPASDGGRKPSPLDLPATDAKRPDGELVN